MKSKKQKTPTSALESEQIKLEAAEEEKRRRYFMGRQDFFQDFEEMIAKPTEERKAWCIYGVGAIGKSWLLAELEDRAISAGYVTSRVDLEGISDPEDFFASLWEGLSEQSRKQFGKTRKRVKKLEKSIKARSKSDEKTLAKIAWVAAKTGAKATSIVAPIVGKAAELSMGFAESVAGELRQETDIEIERLNREMIDVLYADIESGLKKNKFKTAIFLDTFERCSPSIVPSVLSVLEYLVKSAVIVVAGRESLLEFHLPQNKGWDQIIEEKKLEELEKTEIREWLEPGAGSSKAADTTAGIIERISNGFPLLVTFVLETMGNAGVEELISADTADVDKKQQEFFEEQIIKVLEKLDKETERSLWLAAFPRRFDGTLFARYWKLYQEGIGSGDVLKRFQRVQKYSFVHSEGRWLRCHSFIQNAVRRYLFENQKDLWRSLNKISIEYFSAMEEFGPIRETIFHDYQLQPAKSYERFVATYEEIAKDSERWRLADIILEDFSSYCAVMHSDASAEELFDIFRGVSVRLFEYPRGDVSTLCLRRMNILKIAKSIVSNSEHLADIQNLLGITWMQLPTGDRSSNIEKAIGYFIDALKVRTREACPTDWAMTHSNLGNAFIYRIKGERAENIETAIGHFKDALEVCTREASPDAWAAIHNNLGVAFVDRIKGYRSSNIEIAIKYYNTALSVATREIFPSLWARIHDNLGTAYGNRTKGKRGENIETAIKHFNDALEVCTREAYPTEWAKTHNNLGIAFRNQIKGNQASNIERAIEHYNHALDVNTHDAFPEDWAMTHNNLGIAFRNRIKGNRKRNIDTAIEHFNNALKVYTREAFPIEFGEIKNNLAIVFLEEDHPLSEKKRFYIALKHLNDACEVLSPEFPPHRVAFDLRDKVKKRLQEIG